MIFPSWLRLCRRYSRCFCHVRPEQTSILAPLRAPFPMASAFVRDEPQVLFYRRCSKWTDHSNVAHHGREEKSIPPRSCPAAILCGGQCSSGSHASRPGAVFLMHTPQSELPATGFGSVVELRLTISSRVMSSNTAEIASRTSLIA